MKYATVTLGSSKVPWPVLAVCFAAAPLVSVLAVRILTHSHTLGTANGAEDFVGNLQFVMPPLPTLPPEAAALHKAIDAECSQPFGPSPIGSRAPVVFVVPQPAPTKPEPVETPSLPGPQVKAPTLTLTSIMTGKDQPVAIINGKVRKVGDSVGNGFSVTAIDGTAGRVDISNADGIAITLLLKGRRGDQ